MFATLSWQPKLRVYSSFIHSFIHSVKLLSDRNCGHHTMQNTVCLYSKWALVLDTTKKKMYHMDLCAYLPCRICSIAWSVRGEHLSTQEIARNCNKPTNEYGAIIRTFSEHLNWHATKKTKQKTKIKISPLSEGRVREGKVVGGTAPYVNSWIRPRR